MADDADITDRKQDRRRGILEAAAKVFSIRGYSEATCDEIAEAADVSKGTLYNYFESKQDLFTQLFLSTMAEDEAVFDEMLQRHTTAREKLEAVLDHWFAHFGQCHEMGRLVLEFWTTAAAEPQDGTFTQAMQDIYARYRDRLTAVFELGAASGDFVLVYGPALAASVVMALFDGLALHSMMGLGVKMDEKVHEAVKQGMLRALGVDSDPAADVPADPETKEHPE
jgi:AcrR family transcriptional regulator